MKENNAHTHKYKIRTTIASQFCKTFHYFTLYYSKWLAFERKKNLVHVRAKKKKKKNTLVSAHCIKTNKNKLNDSSMYTFKPTYIHLHIYMRACVYTKFV